MQLKCCFKCILLSLFNYQLNYLMKIGVFICFILLLISVKNEALTLYTVSSSATQIISPSGSIRGGTTIYIKGLGFSANAANNQVFVGTYPCNIPAAGATETNLACVTSDTYQNNDIYNLPIIVISNGQQQMLTNEQGCFSYLNSMTPTVLALYPASAIAGTYVNFYGFHRITNLGDGARNLGDVVGMYIGGTQCGRFDITQGPIAANSPDTISCWQALIQEGGKYQVSQYLVPGNSNPDYKLRRSSLIHENYHFAVLPSVSGLSPNSGSVAGQQVTISGTGFSNNASEMAVSVDGTVCDITSSSSNQIVCNLQPKNTVNTSLLTTNSNNQVNGYISGTGLNYKRFDITQLNAKSIIGLRQAINSNDPSIILLESSNRGEVKTGNYYGTNYGQAFTGYFTAPATGSYVFRGVADDSFAVYLSNTFGSAEPNSAPLIYSNTVQNYDNFYIIQVPTAEASVNLVEGNSYYIEVYHLNFAGPGYLKVEAQIPNNDNTLVWQTHAVHKLVLNYTNDPEIIEFTQTGGLSGVINLTVTIKVTGAPSIVQWAAINYNATIGQFISALNTFDCFSPYMLSGYLTTYDANNQTTNQTGPIVTYVWRVYVNLLRPNTAIKQAIVPVFIGYNGTKSFTQVIVKPHGPVIAGSFGISIGQYTLMSAGTSYLRYSISASDLQASFRGIAGLQNTYVDLLASPLSSQYGSTWLISFYGYNGPIPQLVLSNANLMGGVAGTQPQIFDIQIRAYSSSLLVSPIDFPFLSTPSPKPNVLVTVNSVPSVCTGDCTYNFITNSPMLTADSISNAILTLSLTDPSLIGYTLSDVTVTLNGQPCTINNLTSPISSFQCTLPTNSDGTPDMQAGTYTPVVIVSQVGKVAYSNTIVPFNFPLTLTSLDIISGGVNGGYPMILSGKGFPLDPKVANIVICGQAATINSITNIQADIIVPPCSNTNTYSISISNGVITSNTLPFSYVATTPPSVIYSVTPQSYNPSLKGIMEIIGVGFGSNMSALRVDLANSSGKVYKMRVLSLNDTYIKTGIPGGLTGKYNVQVNIIGIGQSFPNVTGVNNFNYELVINSVTPSKGSYNGGTLIHIKGINFSPALDETLVFVGNQINWMCSVQSLNTTDILCRTPPVSEYYNISLVQPVVLTNRLMVDSTCGSVGNCGFTYLDSSVSPQLTSMSTNSITTGQVTLNGSNFDLGTPIVILTNEETGQVTIVTPTNVIPTSLSFTVPSVESGNYNVKIRIDPIGESNGYLLKVHAGLSSVSPSSISTFGGNVVLSGSGLPYSWPNSNFILKVTQNGALIQPKVFSTAPNAFTLTLPSGNNGDSFAILLTSPSGDSIKASVSAQTASTPIIALSSPSSTSAGNIQFTFSQTTLTKATPSFVTIYSLYNTNQVYNGTSIASVSGTVQFNAALTGGLYGFKFYFTAYGWSNCSSTVAVTIAAPAAGSIVSSYNGGWFLISGQGLSSSGTVKINGIKTGLLNVTSTSAVAIIPPYITALTQSQYNLAQPQKLTTSQFAIISDTKISQTNPFDNVQGSVYTSTSTGTCFIGIDVGSGLIFNLSRFRYFPNSLWVIASNYLIGAQLLASNDNANWDTLYTVDSNVHSGWNTFIISTTSNYRYFKFSHNQQSHCSLAQMEFEGILQTDITLSSLTSNTAQVTYEDGSNSFSVNQIEFRQDQTPVVQSLSILNGDVFGNYPLTINGNYLSFATPSILIDGVACNVTTSTSTAITCMVGSRLSLPSKNTFVVSVGNSNAVIYQTFSYVLRWSDIRTWGTDLPPVDGDLISVPAGMNLLVDQSTPLLTGILVQNGTITFADESDMIIRAQFITVVGGKFIAGTEKNPYKHNLQFVMYGGYYSAQMPMFGNKCIACMECFISIHGKVRPYTWTMLDTTININSNTLTVQDPVDWQVGQQIVVASTSFDHKEAERRFITAINGKTITVNTPFLNMHFAGVETYGSDKIEMRAEVGLLTRNIKMMGDETSAANNYGSHLMMAGSAQNGLVGHIAYTQFTNCGQSVIIGRYCIHFHMNGDVSDSFARGNSVHDSMARVITLHGVHYLTVQYNVGYNVKGHNYFIEDGIETNNLLQYNLAISSIQVFTMLQTDISVASFWVTHPTNHFRFNHAAGSDFYGFWYQIKTNPDGPSACADVCPIGNVLGQCHDNVAHSNVRFGLRIFKLAPRTYPCSPLFVEDQVDPWATNPGIISTFSNYTLYKNGEAGLLAQQTAYLIFNNITSAENGNAGAEFYITYFSKDLTILQNSVMIGQTKTNNPQPVKGAKGLITPRLGNIRIDNIRFYNYPQDTISIQTCSHCDHPLLFTNTAQQIYISNISFTNVTGYKLFMNGLKREVLYDMDGTFTTNQFDGTQRQSAAIVNNYKHLSTDPGCKPTTSIQAWDNTLACDQSVTVAVVTFNHVYPVSVFNLVGLKAQQVATINSTVPVDSTAFTQIYSYFSTGNKMEPKSLPKTYALPYITGRVYNIWWLTGLDFDHLQMYSSRYLTDADDGILFKFNYTLNRQMYDVGPIRPNQPLIASSLFSPTSNLTESTCYNGQYYHDNSVGERTFSICASGKNRTYFETTDVTAVYCKYLCPAPPGQFVKEDFLRYWSNKTQWPNGELPQPGDNVTVNGNWTIIMDINPAQCEFLTIFGDVIIEDKLDINITCNAIWLRSGSLKAGSATAPFTHNLTIQLNGYKKDPGYVFDPSLVGNKIFVVTGLLQLYGVSPATVSAKLTASAHVGDSQISVDSASGWSVGDEIVIAPSFGSSRQYERVTITGLNGNIVSITPTISFAHYGDSGVTISNSVGTLDTRASVGHVTRNIKIVSGPDSGWGYSMVVYQMWDGKVSRAGQAILNSVEFTLGGQYDTEAASLVLYNNYDTSMGATIVTRSSFSFCRSFCIRGFTQNNAQITSNVFYEARKFHMKLLQITLFNVDSNIMMGAIIRPTMTGKQPVACIQLTEIDPSTDLITITNNICQGSDLNGYVMPFIPCSALSLKPFINNVAGTCKQVGFLLTRAGSQLCLGFTGVRAYACKVGHISQPAQTSQIRLSNYIIADCQRGVSLRFGLQGTDRSAYFDNSYFTQISRPSCAQCYGNGKIDCSGNTAIRLLAVTINGQTYPKSFDSGFDGLCKQQTFDSKAFLTNVNFDYYKNSYESTLSQCSNNVLFTSNPGAPDYIGGHHLWNSTCTNCQMGAMAYFDAPIARELGWFGGCGNILCTGRNNYIIEDHTDTLFPQGGFLLANNSWIGDNTPGCTFISSMNGYHCTRHDFGALEYESIAPDYNTRIMWPVTLHYDGGNWTSITNGFKEWEWSGSEPMNKRLARFISVIQLQKVYNMSFSSNPPDDMRFQLQKRIPTGNNSDWVVIKLYYPFPNSIQVSVNGKVIRPISLLDNNGQIDLNTASCGSNKFFYQNYTIHFVVTGDPSCLVRVRLTSVVQLTMRFAMNINDFFNTGGPTRLVDRMCAIFHISDQSKVKIVGIYSGSVIVVVQIASSTPPDNSYAFDASADINGATQILANITSTSTDGQFDDFGGLVGMDSQLIPVHPIPAKDQSSGDDTNTKIMIGVIASVGALLIISAAIIIFLKKRSNNKISVEQIPAFSSGSQGSHEKGINIKKEHDDKQGRKMQITEQNISEVIFDRPI